MPGGEFSLFTQIRRFSWFGLLSVQFVLGVPAASATALYGDGLILSAYPVTLACGSQSDGGTSGSGFTAGTTSASPASISASCNSSTGFASGTANFANLQGMVTETNGGSGTYSGSWEDTLTITGPPNTMVSLVFSLSLNSDILTTGFVNSQYFASAVSNFWLSTPGGDQPSPNTTITDSNTFNNATQPSTLTTSEQLSFTTGMSFGIVENLMLTCSQDNAAPASCSVDPGTGLVINDITPGTSFSSASGDTYAGSAAPEPSSIVLCAIGAIALVIRMRHPA